MLVLTELDNAHIRLGSRLVDGDPGYPLNPILYGIGDMGHTIGEVRLSN